MSLTNTQLIKQKERRMKVAVGTLVFLMAFLVTFYLLRN